MTHVMILKVSHTRLTLDVVWRQGTSPYLDGSVWIVWFVVRIVEFRHVRVLDGIRRSNAFVRVEV